MEIKNKLKKLEELARHEEWNTIDKEVIPELCKIEDSMIISWAKQNLHNKDDNVRDVAASLLEKHSIPKQLLPKIKNELLNVVKNDKYPYAQYRAAFALANHCPGEYKDLVIAKLKEAEKDPDVKEIAKNYLRKIKET